MIIVTTNDVPGYRILAVQGEVMGLTVRSRDIGAQWVAGFRSMAGGEIPEFTQMLFESRMQAMGRLVGEAEERGANAVIAMRFDVNEIAQAWTEICVYGTAVTVEPIASGEGATVQSMQVAAAESAGRTSATPPPPPHAFTGLPPQPPLHLQPPQPQPPQQ